MIAHAHIRYRLTTQEELAQDPLQTGEWVFEGTYRISAANGLTTSPDVQYLVHPYGEKSIPNALALAARVKINS